MVVNEEEKRRIINLHFNQGKTIRVQLKIAGPLTTTKLPPTFSRLKRGSRKPSILTPLSPDTVTGMTS